MNKKYDVVIIGGGPAGITSALYSLRANLKVALIEEYIVGGQMNNTLEIENYPSYSSITGQELSQKMFSPLENFSNFTYINSRVNKINEFSNNKLHSLELDNQEILYTKTIIIATGAKHKKLNIPGEEEFNGMGVSYCAICDGAFFKDKDVVVVGGGDSALEESLYLSNIVNTLTIIHRRDEFRAQEIYQEKIKNIDNIKIIYNSVVSEIIGDSTLKKVKIENVLTREISELNCNGIFIYIGLTPNTKFIESNNIDTNNGWIITDNDLETSIKGIFAAGDVRDKNLRQIITASSDGALAAQSVYKYIKEKY